jgi:L-arabinose isomerase
MAGVELAIIDSATTVREFKKELRLNEAYYG